MLLNFELTSGVTPALPVPVAVAVKVSPEPIDPLQPLKVKIPSEDVGVHESVAPPVTAAEIEPAYGDWP